MADSSVVFKIDVDTSTLKDDLDAAQKTLTKWADDVAKTLTVPVNVDTSDASSALTRLESSQKKAASSSTLLSGNMGTLIKTMAGATVVKKAAEMLWEAAKAGVEYNAQMEQYQANFSTLLGDEAEALQFVAKMREMAANTPFGMTELSQASQTLLSFGVSAEKTESVLQRLGDISMGNADRLSGLSLAFAQVSSAGKLTGQDLMQMINAGFNPLQTIAEQTGASLADLKEFMSGGSGGDDFQRMMKAAQNEVKRLGARASESAKILAQLGNEGVISADIVGKAIEIETSAGGRFYQGMERASQTVEGLRSTLHDNFSQFAGYIAQPLSELEKIVLRIGVDVLENLNGIFDSFGASSSTADRIEQTGDAARSTVDDLAEQASVARVLTNQLASLGEYSELTAEGQMRWQAVASELVKVAPELSSYIDVQNGVFLDGVAAIYEHIDALEQEAKVQALLTAQSDILQQSVESQKEYFKASAAYDRAEAERAARQETRVNKEAEILEKYGMTIDELMLKRDNLLMLPALTITHTKKEIDKDIKDYESLVKEERRAEKSAEKLMKTRDELKIASEEAMAQSQAEVEALQRYAESLGIFEQAISPSGGSTLGGNFVEMADGASQLRDQLESLETEGQQVEAMFAQIEQYKADNLQKITERVEGLYDTFDKADRVRSTNVKRMGANIESQIKQHEQYQQYIKQLKEMGASDALLSEFGFDTESLAQMQAILKSGPEGLAGLEAKYATLKSEQAETTALLNENAQAVDTTLKEMEQAAQDANTALNKKMADIVASADKMSVEVKSDTQSAEEAVETVQTAGDALGLSEWEPTIDAEDNASEIIRVVSQALDRLDGKSIQVYIEAVESGFGGADGSHKTGLDYVPFDGYIAELHKGETVLPADVARDYRRGIIGRSLPDVSGIASGMAPRPLMLSGLRYAPSSTEASGVTNQTINFNVPVQTPGEFAQTMYLYQTYGLTEA